MRRNIVIATCFLLQAREKGRPLPQGHKITRADSSRRTEVRKESLPGKNPSSSAQEEKQEPSADTEAGPSDKSPCTDKEFIHALCGPLSASWQIGSLNAQTFRFMLGAANSCMLLDFLPFPTPLISSFAKNKRGFIPIGASIRSVAYT